MARSKPWSHPPSALTDSQTCPFCEAKAKRGLPVKIKRYACKEHGWAYQVWWDSFYRSTIDGVPEDISAADPRWASEKLWRDAEAALKAVAKARGWPHDDEHDLRAVISRIYQETRDAEYLDLFSVVESLHMNFYEDWLSTGVVALYADDARRLVAKLQALAV